MRVILLFLSLALALPQVSCSSPVEAGPYTFIRARQALDPGFPLNLPGIALWMDASDASTVDDSTATPDVDSWTDKSAAGHVLVQGTAAAKPHISTEINGLGTITFDGTDDVLREAVSSVFSGTKGYMYAVIKMPNPVASGTLLNSSDEATASHSFVWTYQNRNFTAQQFQTVTSGTNNSVFSDTSDMVADTAYLVAVASDGSTWSFRRNGAAMASAIQAGANVGNWFGDVSSRDNLTIGAWVRSTSFLFMDGIIGEMIVVNGEDLTAPLITTIEAAFNAKWSIY